MHNLDPETIKYENERLLLKDKYLMLKESTTAAKLSKNQRILILCLMNDIIEKEKIIQNVWGANLINSREKNYNQLIFQTRSLLARQGFPNDLIMTIHRYGLCFNKFILSQDNQPEKTNNPLADIQL